MRPIQMLLLRPSRPGGFAPPDPPSPFARGAPMPRSAPAAARPWRARARRESPKKLGAAADRQRDPEARSSRGLRAHVDASIVRINDFSDNRQSKSRAL